MFFLLEESALHRLLAVGSLKSLKKPRLFADRGKKVFFQESFLKHLGRKLSHEHLLSMEIFSCRNFFLGLLQQLDLAFTSSYRLFAQGEQSTVK